MKRTIIIAGAILALGAPALAQEPTTLQHVTTKGTVIKADMQGTPLELPMKYNADGTYTTNAMGQELKGKIQKTFGDVKNNIAREIDR